MGKESDTTNTDAKDESYIISILTKLLLHQMNECPLSVKLTCSCAVIAQLYSDTNLSEEEFLKIINNNIKVLM
jgi:DNA-binding transcriptional regulator YiaG